MQEPTGQQWVNSYGSSDLEQTSVSAPKSLSDIYISQGVQQQESQHQGSSQHSSTAPSLGPAELKEQ
eukprot:5289171-Amphidinium_carterae.1